jgi:hypothetical protein
MDRLAPIPAYLQYVLSVFLTAAERLWAKPLIFASIGLGTNFAASEEIPVGSRGAYAHLHQSLVGHNRSHAG